MASFAAAGLEDHRPKPIVVPKGRVKPKLAYFQTPPANYAPFEVQWMVDGLLQGLAEFFEVVPITTDCDYEEICHRHQPDLAMFEGVVEADPGALCRLQIKNPSAFPEIPKIGFMKIDPYSPVRSVFFAEMERLGIETIFAWDPAMAEYTPEMAGRFFYWPAFVDTTLFHDYGERKVIPLLFLGRCDGPSLQHSWRVQVKALASTRYPSMVVPHPGPHGGRAFPVHGEAYARLLNASQIVPTAGSMSKTLVMKHLEIPAARACLLTERTPIVEAFGFTDMENCIFADEHDVLDKLDWLFKNPDALERITTRGYQFVRSRHTGQHRPQILQWLELSQCRAPGQRIVQRGLFRDLELVDERSAAGNHDIVGGCPDRTLLRRGDDKLMEGKYREAETLYGQCLDYVSWMAEPRLRLAVCKLYQGNARDALDWLRVLLKASLGEYQSPAPDPVEWAYLLIALLCHGDLRAASQFAEYLPELHHVDLARARWAVFVLSGRRHEAEWIEHVLRPGVAACPSLHRLPPTSFEEYVGRLCDMLRRCQQRRFAKILAAAAATRRPAGEALGHGSPPEESCGARKNLPKDDIPYVLETIDRLHQAGISAHLKRRLRPVVADRVVPALGRRVKDFVRPRPRLRKAIKAFVMDHLRMPEW